MRSPFDRRLPLADSLPASPVDWEDIPFGPGQIPGAQGMTAHSLQFTNEGDKYHFTDTRRNPDETFVILSRPPERW